MKELRYKTSTLSWETASLSERVKRYILQLYCKVRIYCNNKAVKGTVNLVPLASKSS